MKRRLAAGCLGSAACLALVGVPAFAHPGPGSVNEHLHQIRCFNVVNDSSFIYATPLQLLAHPETNQVVVGGDGHRYGSEWVYFRAATAWLSGAGAWITSWGDWLAIKDGTAGVFGNHGGWWHHNPQTGGWERPSGWLGSPAEPRSGVFTAYSPGATVWVGGWIWWGPVAGHPTFRGEWHWTGWTDVRC